jgi:uncharacterized protein YdeI (YjbR/CyaY-like superfamily)
MGKKDKRIDIYISSAQPFAKPILKHFREIIHKACPDVEETMKWSFPHFDYKGSMMCSMAAFKQHMAFGFWKGAIMKDKATLLGKQSKEAMGNLGRITSIKDLPKDNIITGWIKEAMKLNDAGIKLSKTIKPKHERKEYKMPDYFAKALSKNKKAKDTFENFSPSHKREYLEWIVEAKTEDTRNKRISTALEWLSEGKIRNWKYIKK